MSDAGSFVAHIAPDGSFWFEDVEVQAGLRGTSPASSSILVFDVTDSAMRSLRSDPYLHRKKRFLEQTEGLREKLRAHALKSNLRDALEALEPRLESIVGRDEMSWAERRKLLFEIWDGAVETGDDARGRAGHLVRSRVLGFIAERLPPGTPGAYPVEELTKLDALRRSEAHFRPYRGSGRGASESKRSLR